MIMSTCGLGMLNIGLYTGLIYKFVYGNIGHIEAYMGLIYKIVYENVGYVGVYSM